MALPRNALPQIPSDQIDKFCKYLEGYDIGVVRGFVNIDSLHPIQKNVNIEKVKALRSDKEALKKPILIAQDGGILDGHHRWIANKSLGKKKQPVIKCACPMKQLLTLGHQFDGSEIKTIHEMTEYGEEQWKDTDESSHELLVRKTLNYK